MWTRWGQSRPLYRCAALSLIVHLCSPGLTMTVKIVVGDGGGTAVEGPPIRVRVVDEVDDRRTASRGTIGASVALVSADVVPPPDLEAPESRPRRAEVSSPAEIEPVPALLAARREPVVRNREPHVAMRIVAATAALKLSKAMERPEPARGRGGRIIGGSRQKHYRSEPPAGT